jgi:hypothetical protein
VKARLAAAAFLVGSYANALAEMFPIIDVRYGYLIGAASDGNWIEPTDATDSVKPGTKLEVYGVTGAVGTVSVVKLDTQNEPCPDRPVVKLNPPKMKSGAIAFAASWNTLPRKAKSLDVKDKKYVDIVREFLREHALKNPIAQITQVAQIDLDGAGEDDVVISATHYKDGDKIRDESTANTYSFVMLARFQQGTTKTELVPANFIRKRKAMLRQTNSRLQHWLI